MGKSVVATPLTPSSVQNLFLDCKKIFDTDRYGNCSMAFCFSAEKAGATSMFFWDAKGDGADQIVACQRVIRPGLLERRFDALRILFYFDDRRDVENLLGQPGSECFREKVISASDFVIPGDFVIERLVTQHEQRGPRFDSIVDTAYAQQGYRVGRSPPAAQEIGPAHLVILLEGLR